MINQQIEPSEKSGIQKHLNNVLDHFKQLLSKDRYSKKAEKTEESSDDDDEGVPVVFHCIPPPSKKPKFM